MRTKMFLMPSYNHGGVQRFLATHDQINTVVRPRRYQFSAVSYRHTRTDAFGLWGGHALEMTA
jgi:putative transposase